jgi:catechol 2,3-dioxygenase-like lactoylglutathione lyase family enzyme
LPTRRATSWPTAQRQSAGGDPPDHPGALRLRLNIELFQYSSPDQKTVTPKNSDVGGYHIAFYVDDIKAAKDYLDGKGVKTLFGPFPVNEGPAAGRSIVYFLAPWPANGDHQLSERDGLREVGTGGAVVAARAGEVRFLSPGAGSR